MTKRIIWLLAATSALTACSLAPDFTVPDVDIPASYKEQPTGTQADVKGAWKPAQSLEGKDRGQWWLIFGDEQLNAFERQAAEASQSLKSAAARVEEARAMAKSQRFSFLPDLDIGANAVRAQQSAAALQAFGAPPGPAPNPYTLYSAQGVLSYEADLFGRVRDNYHALEADADAQAAAYRSALLALQADVAQNYFMLRTMDAERALLRETVTLRTEAARIMQRKFDVGVVGEQDNARAQADLASINAELYALDRSRAQVEHALAVLLGKMPGSFSFPDSPLADVPPAIPAGLPSSLLQRRPDVSAAQSSMAAANLRVGVARTAFFPIIGLTASGGFESAQLSDLFQWSSRTWALGQTAGSAITMPIFDSGRNFARLDVAHAAFDEAVANYKQQVLVAFRDVEDNLISQQLLAQQSQQLDTAADAAGRTTYLTQRRFDQGDADYFEVVNTQRDSLAAQRAAIQTRGQRFVTTVSLIRALGGGWDEAVPTAQAEPVTQPAPQSEPAPASVTETPAAPPVETLTESSSIPAQPEPQPTTTPAFPADAYIPYTPPPVEPTPAPRVIEPLATPPQELIPKSQQ